MSQNGLYWQREVVANDLIESIEVVNLKAYKISTNNSLQKIAFNEKKFKKEYIFLFIFESLHCTPETIL